jgi:non-specific serine/threonine protein kinase
MERPASPASPASSAFSYRFGSAEFDESRFELRVAGLPVEVERRALEVLAYLLRHAGEVVTKEELLREVWAGRVTVDKVLPNAINKIRRALGESNAGLVSTQARVGYRLDGPVTRTAVGRQLASTLALEPGQPVPGRPSFVLERQLGRTAGSEVWLASHPKTAERRVYKFALDSDRLRGLKREVTLLRVLQECLDDASHVVEAIDWNFEHAPYFIECRYGGPTLAEWAARHLDQLDTRPRLAIFLQIADAVAAAHAVGVLHKDLKPANVLVDGPVSAPHVRLTDFGSGLLMEPDRLEQLGITRMGLTVEDRAADGSTSGTPLYIAPELFAGQAPTVKSDVYALGVLLYQLLTGRLGQPMAPGWEAEIADELLRDDLLQATDGRPEYRLDSVSDLAYRLRRFDERRAELDRQRRNAEAARRDRETLERTRARRPLERALLAVMAVGVVVALWFQQQAAQARNDAREELARANALARFVNEDLIGRSNPLVSAKGPEATLREVLLAARERVPVRFAAQPDTAAALHGSLASLYNTIDLFAEAEAEARQALRLLERAGGTDAAAAFEVRAVLVRVLGRAGRLDEARVQLDALEQLAAAAPEAERAHRAQRLAAARSTWLIARGEFAKAVTELRAAIAGLDPGDAASTPQRDSLRLDLIATLTMARQDAEAVAEGSRLIEEARQRPQDSELLVALAKLALVRAHREDHAAAERLLLEARPVIEARLGPTHTRQLQLLGELLGVAFRRADWPQAIVHAREVHERVQAKLGTEHVLTYVTLTNWARTLVEAGRAREALPAAREAHAQLQRRVGTQAPQAQDAAFVLALAELEAGELARAEALVAGLDARVLEGSRATGQWQAGIDALNGMALARRGDKPAARRLLASSLQTLQTETQLRQPSRLFVVAQQAQATLR